MPTRRSSTRRRRSRCASSPRRRSATGRRAGASAACSRWPPLCRGRVRQEAPLNEEKLAPRRARTPGRGRFSTTASRPASTLNRAYGILRAASYPLRVRGGARCDRRVRRGADVDTVGLVARVPRCRMRGRPRDLGRIEHPARWPRSATCGDSSTCSRTRIRVDDLARAPAAPAAVPRGDRGAGARGSRRTPAATGRRWTGSSRRSPRSRRPGVASRSTPRRRRISRACAGRSRSSGSACRAGAPHGRDGLAAAHREALAGRTSATERMPRRRCRSRRRQGG